ncbi:MAG: class I SAM-dependent rRNA methyltransferase [Deltaproteobacteria bacterium]|nr:class I SAM-dependent rRNA methyltransferase [Deltaproteobacteria bacterium]
MATIRLKPGHVQPVWTGHPWVFSQAIDAIEGAPGPGDVVDVHDPRGAFLGRGFYSPRSAIPVRIATRDRTDPLDVASLARRIEDAYRWRRERLGLPSDETTGYRLVHAEGDLLPGLVVDVFGKVAAVQFLTVGTKSRESDLVAAVQRATGAESILEVPSPRNQRIEGFEVVTGVVRGPDVTALAFRERGFDYEIPVEASQKTGFYFDQRDNRALVEKLAHGARVLDAFCYVGSFSLAAARGGASEVVAIDSSPVALLAGATIAKRHGLEASIHFTRADLKRHFQTMAQEGRQFDIVVCDPPRFATTAKDVEAARSAYRRLNGQAFRLVAPGGLLVTCSCSHAMRADDFIRTVATAARDAGRETTMLSVTGQAPDHPVPPAFPEGRYLKCVLLRVS